MAGKALNSRFLAFNQVRFGRTGKSFENRHKPYARPLYAMHSWRNSQAEFVKWFGPLLDALRELVDSGKPREVSNKIAETLNLSDEVLEKSENEGVNGDRDLIMKLGLMFSDLAVEFNKFLLDKYSALFKQMVNKEKDYLFQKSKQIGIDHKSLTRKAELEGKQAKEKMDNLQKAIDSYNL